MTDISKLLLKSLHSIFKQNPNTTFSKPVQEFLKKIHKFIISGDTNFAKDSLIKSSEILQKSGRNITKGLMYSSIPRPIRSILERSVSLEQTYELDLKGDKYKICMVYPLTSKSTLKKITAMFQEALYKIYLWLFIVHEFAPPECSQNMTIYIYFTNHLKNLANIQGEPLDQIHSNTAFTTSCSPSTEINIFREEEWFKVFIHETFHNLGLDFSSMDDDKANQFILTLFPIKSNQGIRLYETYCETWAEILNCFVSAYLHSRSNKSFPHVFELFTELMFWESKFSVLQCVKVLRHYGLTYQQLVETEDPVSRSLRENYRENTYVLSYYIIKSILLFHSNKFLEWCLTNNTNVVEFNKTEDHIIKFCVLIKSLYENEDYLNDIRTIEPYLNSNNNSTEGKTLRMTLFG